MSETTTTIIENTIQSLLTLASLGMTAAGVANPAFAPVSIMKIVQLALTLEPTVAGQINSIIDAFSKAKTPEELHAQLESLTAFLQPMSPKE